MKFVCEICNQKYDSAAMAEQCELAHKKEYIANKAQADASTKINEAVNAYVAKYKELPELDLTEDSQKIILASLAGKVTDTIGMLIEMFAEDDEDDSECEKCACDCKKADVE